MNHSIKVVDLFAGPGGLGEGFDHLTAFQEREGHCRVAQAYKAEDGFRLGQWVANRRRKRDKLSPEHKARLYDLGFEWHLQGN